MTENLNAAAAAQPEATTSATTSDGARARELYKYFSPLSTLGSGQAGTPDTVLTAHAQLVSWRLNCQRAMVSLIDRDIQYFVAESTKTLHLDDFGHENPDDAIWAGCINVPKTGRLCEHTIATMPPPSGGTACFEVLNLSQDERFNKLDFVVNAPKFRYYCGVPLRTNKGISIGSLFALDDKVREPISDTNRHFLGVMADNVMSHLEMIKEKEDRKRALNMNMCLAAFVDPEHQVRKRKRKRSDGPVPKNPSANSKIRYHPTTVSTTVESGNANFVEELDKKDITPVSLAQAEGSSSPYESDSSSERVGEDDHLETFQRAAELLRDALDLESGGGGVVFMDTAAALGKTSRWSKGTSDESSGASGAESERETPQKTATRDDYSIQSRSWAARNPSEDTKSQLSSPPSAITIPAGVLGHSRTALPRMSNSQTDLTKKVIPLSPNDLSRLIKRHPRGKLFTFNSEGGLATSSSDNQPHAMKDTGTRISKKAIPSKLEANLLTEHFPSARQIVFLPLWDSTTSRWSACFAYNNSEYRTLTNNPDFLYCIAFGNCIMTEIARLATMTADQQKSDFIGSVSHELRSPLHGILASCEFLGETECNSFQKSLVDTADSCARTLLDTINMVLDYSKINAFERNTNKTKRSRRDVLNSAVTGVTPTLQSHLNLYSDVDLAAITEEVVEGVATGHVFKDSLTSVDVQNMQDTDGKGYATDNSFSNIKLRKADVEIVLDIPSRDWTYWSQAGALRRVVMNLFGNSLKYTKLGFIKVKLEAQDIQKPGPGNADCFVTLTITDSGQGISPEYIRTRLFTPFAQESSLAPGTGLGLSLVRSLVNMLQGEINIKSTLNVGTEVTVRLPMSKGVPVGSKSGSTPSSSGSTIERVKDDSLKVVKEQASMRTVATYWTDHQGFTQKQVGSTRMLQQSMDKYLTGWCGLTVSNWDPSTPPDILITDELELQGLIATSPQLRAPGCQTMVLVLCTAASRQTTRHIFANSNNFEELRHPFGPYKLARAMRVCFDRFSLSTTPRDSRQGQASTGAIVDTIPESVVQSAYEEVITAVEAVKLQSTEDSDQSINVLKHGPTVGKEDSVNALMAMNNLGALQISDTSSHSDSREEFPFPADGNPRNDGTISPSVKNALLTPGGSRPDPVTRRTISPTHGEIRAHDKAETSAMSSKGALAIAAPRPSTVSATTNPRERRTPRMLLVDDNRINLRLLQTFMKKRKYENITNAEDGLQAVTAYSTLLSATPPTPPEIILMDISMPIMNGFEATRKIREIEKEYRDKQDPMCTPPSCLIIALTGLASGRDQSEAFTSGFDLYITKPVSFAEIGRLLDNWETNGGAGEGVPHGSATAASGAEAEAEGGTESV